MLYAETSYFARTAGLDESSPGGSLVNMPLRVAAILDVSYGKWGGGDRLDIAMMEASSFWANVNKSLPSTVNPTVRAKLVSLPLNDAVSYVIANLPPERFRFYASSNFGVNARKVVAWASELVYLVGANQVDVRVPVLEELFNIRFASSFLGLVLNMVILLLVGISIMLIYSLFVISVEARTFELGIFRMVGLTRSGLVQMLLVRSVPPPPPPLTASHPQSYPQSE
jgi:hypothetical protein